jgi:hypothetical protein
VQDASSPRKGPRYLLESQPPSSDLFLACVRTTGVIGRRSYVVLSARDAGVAVVAQSRAAEETGARAAQRRDSHPRFVVSSDGYKLADAQFVIAREYGFASCPKFKAFIEGDWRRRPTRAFVTEAK